MAQFSIRLVGKNPDRFKISGLGASLPGSSFTPTNEEMTEEDLRAQLKSQGISDRGIDQLIQRARAGAE